MAKPVAAVDITYPDKKGRPVVRWKQGEEIDDPKIAEILMYGAKELIKSESDKPVKKPTGAGKKKGTGE